MYFIAAIIGLAAGIVVWCATSYLVVRFIVWVEARRPQLAGTKSIHAIEISVCGAVFVACLALSFWIARLLWLQWQR